MGASALAGGSGPVVVVGRRLLVLLRLLLGLGTVVELAGASERLVGEAVEVVGAGGLVVVGAGAGAAAGRRSVMRAAATPTATPRRDATRMTGSGDRLALHQRPGRFASVRVGRPYSSPFANRDNVA